MIYRDGKYFKLKEFACPSDGSIVVSAHLIEMLDKLREEFGKPLNVTSGYRTPEHNAKVGGAANSQHLLGLAADLAPHNRGDLPLLRYLAMRLEFPGIGYYPSRGFVHVDVREGEKARWAEGTAML